MENTQQLPPLRTHRMADIDAAAIERLMVQGFPPRIAFDFLLSAGRVEHGIMRGVQADAVRIVGVDHV